VPLCGLDYFCIIYWSSRYVWGPWRYLLVALGLYDFRHQCGLSFCIPETLGCCPHFGSQLSYRSSESPRTPLVQCHFKPFILYRWTTVSLSAVFHTQHQTACSLVKCKILRQSQCKLTSIKIAHYCTHTCRPALAATHSV